MYRQKKTYSYCASERLRNIYFQDSKYICIHTYTIDAVSFKYLWYGASINDITDKTLKSLSLKYMNMRVSGASELRKFSHFHILKLLFHSIFCWYFRYRTLSQKHIYFRVSNNICIHNTQSMHFPFITYGMMLYRADKALTLRKCMYMRASLENFRIFTF